MSQVDSLTIRIEEGSIYYEDHKGNWITTEQMDWICNNFPDEVSPILDEYPEIQQAIQCSKDGLGTFLVTLYDMSFESDAGYWDLNYGYINPECYIEGGGGAVEIKET